MLFRIESEHFQAISHIRINKKQHFEPRRIIIIFVPHSRVYIAYLFSYRNESKKHQPRHIWASIGYNIFWKAAIKHVDFVRD